MGKKDKCCDRYKKKDEYCRGCPIVDSCALAPQPDRSDERKDKKQKMNKEAKQARKEKKEKKDKKYEKTKKGKKGKAAGKGENV